eukprot:gnl/Spiro4/17516_TR9325_c0_g2_i1.p1 gnl/Spiro4/17516_TR9325_c0_g2~~gnl/Spiro4/17516_TR9325_c0_g2_i1.p1  ORF type:complete len:373 (-),score=122.62 gnl/Spiro4/17516_TR9325_c0_g2_i1:513-1631(-)
MKFLSTTSYEKFLRDTWHLSSEAISYFRQRTLDFFALPPAHVPALDCIRNGYPGGQGIRDLVVDPHAEAEMSIKYVHHFPDGNASIARLLVRSLVPGVAAGSTMEDVVLAPFDYSKLDVADSSVRIRLHHAVVRAANANGGVRVVVRSNASQQLTNVVARHPVLACYNMAIPYILGSEAPEPQRAALAMNVKAPLVYTNVALRNWEPWVRLRLHEAYCVGLFHSRIKLDFPVSIGSYSASTDPKKPCLVHMVYVPAVSDSESVRDSLRAARNQLFALQYEDYVAHVKEDLTRLLGPGGFDADRDIAAITVNRWSHGYSYASNTLEHADADADAVQARARQKIGNIVVANSDSAWEPYLHGAIDQAHLAVSEL